MRKHISAGIFQYSPAPELLKSSWGSRWGRRIAPGQKVTGSFWRNRVHHLGGWNVYSLCWYAVREPPSLQHLGTSNLTMASSHKSRYINGNSETLWHHNKYNLGKQFYESHTPCDIAAKCIKQPVLDLQDRLAEAQPSWETLMYIFSGWDKCPGEK